MAGIYIHIPFCRRKCSYCDFYKTTDFSVKEQTINAILHELSLRKSFIGDETVNTIYFGGGTPSILSFSEINTILEKTQNNFCLNDEVEITLEANPDDLDPQYLKQLTDTKINRLSIGIQSFFENDLRMMKRRHNSVQAEKCVENAYGAGFSNISIDLIYGLPGLNTKAWKENLQRAFSLPVTHVSAYHLTYHQGTAFYDLLKKGLLKEIDEDESVAQFELLIEMAVKEGFEYYEISNFAKNGLYSKHNSSYWFNEKYLGIGPSAHSFNREVRQWNVSDTNKYISGIKKENGFFESEKLSETDKFNDYIITRLRTKWGITESYIIENFGSEKNDKLIKEISPYINDGYISEKDGNYTLTPKGIFISDKIMESLIFLG